MKIMQRRHLLADLCCAVIVMLGTILAAEAIAQTRTLKLAYVAPPPVWGPVADFYAKEVSQRESKLEIKSFGGGQLGDLQKNFAEMKMGQLDLMLCDSGVISMPKGGEHFNVVFAPYAFGSQAHMRKFFSSDLFKSMMAQTEKEAGIKYLGWVSDRSPRLITTSNRKVVTPDDMKGLKLRVPMTKTITAILEAWGATPIPLSAAEMYMAMKQGTVDGQDNGFDAIYGAKYYEVQKYVSPIDYIRSGLIILVSEATWKKLDDKERNALLDACGPTDQFATKLNDETVAKAIQGVEEKGMVIVKPDIEAFKRTAAKAIQEQLDGKLWPQGLYDKVRAME